MSTWLPIWTTIKEHEAAGRLRAFAPRSRAVVKRRPIFLVPEFHDVLVATHLDPIDATRYIALQARLEMFLGDEQIASSYMKALRPLRKGVWEIVNKKPNPSLRVFGLFATRDVFIGTHHQLRNVLGGFNTPMWKEEIRRAGAEWRNLFDAEPLIGRLHEVVSGVVYV
jgi:hypothetical protein